MIASTPDSSDLLLRALGPTYIIDSREQTPFDLGTVPTVRAALPAGDYSIVGAETRIALERKTLDDWNHSTTWEWPRFERELVKLQGYEFAAVIVEANIADVEARRYRAKVHPSAVLGRAVAVTLEYAPVLWAGDHARAGRLCLRFLRRFYDKRMCAAVAA